MFSRNTVCLNAESNLRFGSAAHLNLGLNFGLVLQSSGSNFSSEPNFSNTTKENEVVELSGFRTVKSIRFLGLSFLDRRVTMAELLSHEHNCFS